MVFVPRLGLEDKFKEDPDNTKSRQEKQSTGEDTHREVEQEAQQYPDNGYSTQKK